MLHSIIVEAAEGRLPAWAQVRPARRRHLAAVAGTLGAWAVELGLSEQDRLRWRAAGWLHDALRDAGVESLAADAAEFPKRVRHGPAAAARLRGAGLNDEEMLEAIAYHSLGRGGMGRLGRYLYLADYLEPGRRFNPAEHAALRARLPEDLAGVLRTVCERRVAELLGRGLALRSETVEFWNELVAGR